MNILSRNFDLTLVVAGDVLAEAHELGFCGIKIGKNEGGMQNRISGLPTGVFIRGLDNCKLSCVPSGIIYATQRGKNR